MIRFLRRYWLETVASVATLTAVMFPVLASMTALGIDVSNWLMVRRNLQTAADAAAITAAWEVANGNEEDYFPPAEIVAMDNGLNPDSNGILNIVLDDEVAGTGGVITATINQDGDLFFSKLLMGNRDVSVEVEAEATITPPGYDYCILALDTVVSGAIDTMGNVNLQMPDCGIAVNSSSDSALEVSGNVTMNLDDIHIVGGYSVSGGSANITYNSLETNAAAVRDPYADLTVPSFTACTSSQMRHPTRVNSNTTLNPGVYCGGITITGNNTVTFNPGLYILDGGDLNVSGNGSIVATGVSFVFTNSGGSSYGSWGNIDITGGRTINVSAMTTGAMAGVAFYVDRNAPSSEVNRIEGSNTILVNGAIYTPTQEINFGGNSSAVANMPACTQVVGKTVVLHGTPYLGSDCEGTNNLPIGFPSVRLTG